MVYSNNKSHKLLIILLIFIFYFIGIFFTCNVFGADLDTESLFGYNISFDESLFGENNYIMYIYKQGSYIGVDLYVSDSGNLNRLSSGTSDAYNVRITRGHKFISYLASLGQIRNFNSQSATTALNNKISDCMNSYNSSTPMTTITTQPIYKRSDYGTGVFYSNSSIYVDNNIIFNPVVPPELANSLSDLETLNFDVISVNAWSWSNKDFDILFYDNNVTDTSNTYGLYPKRVITLNQNTTYFQSSLSANPNTNAIYWIPIDEIGLNLYVGGSYVIKFAERVPLNPSVAGADYSYNYLGEPINFTISSDVSQDKINAINKAIEDMTNQKYHDETINSLNNLNDALTNTTPDSSVSSDIDNSLNFNNNNQGLNNLNGGFFSRLTSMLSNLLGYNLGEDTSVSIPLPNTDKSIVLHSKDIYDNVTGTLRLIINAFWVYIFTFYMWKFINKIYIAVSTGNILDGFSSGGEAITNDML